MRIDLHTHSTASDGTDPPAEVVRLAAGAGLDVLALTDHDTTAGWTAAAQAARETGIGFVHGLEVSTRRLGRGVHVLAYLPDPTFEPLVGELARIVAGRAERIPAMLDGLAAAGYPMSEEEVSRQVGPNGVAGRPHVAQVLVDRGYARDTSDAFHRLLGPGGPAYSPRYAPETVDLVQIVTAAGGAAVVAHPWRGRGRSVLTAETLAGLAAAGLAGVEVDHQEHSASDRAELRGLAAELGLLVTGSSDYHGTRKVDHELGCNTTSHPAFERLLAVAAANAARSGRRVPQPVGLDGWP